MKERPDLNKLAKAKRKLKPHAYAILLFNKQFGTDLLSRLQKLKEEYKEVNSASVKYFLFREDEKHKNELIDELSDLYAVTIHTASVLGVSHDDLIELAIDKVEARIKDPNYKRQRHEEDNV